MSECYFTLVYNGQASLTNLHDGSAVICNGLLAILVNHEQVTTVRTKSGLDGGLDSETGIDVGDNLTLALRSIGA